MAFSPYGGLLGFNPNAQFGRFGDPNDPANLPNGLQGLLAQQQDMPAPNAQPMEAQIPMPPQRPAEFGPSTSQQPMSIQPQGLLAPPAKAPEQGGMGSGFDKFVDKLGNIYGNGGGGDALINMGLAIASPGNRAQNLQRAMMINSQQSSQKNAQALQQLKLQREQGALSGNMETLKKAYPDWSEQQLMAGAQNAAVVQEAIKRLSPQEQFKSETDAEGNIWQTNSVNGQKTLLKKAENDIQKVDITKPDGTTQPAWVKRGENNVQYIGPEQQAPAGAIPAGVDPAKYREEMAKKAATQEAAKVERTRAAETAMPHLDRATKAYETLANLEAIGPMSASGMSRLWGGMKGSKDEIARQDFEAAAKELELMKSQISMKGQGTITDGERKILALTLPRLDAADPKTGLETLRMMRDSFKKDFGGKVEADPTQQQQPQAPLNGARKAPDGNWYIKQGDKWHKVVQ